MRQMIARATRKKSDKPDPAPSRLAYRLQRLALTPSVRRGFTFGVPLFAVGLIVTLSLADQDRRDAVTNWVADIKSQVQTREEFMVKMLAVDGASDTVTEDVREVLALDFPISSFDLDLVEMQNRVQALDAIKTVSLRIKPGGVLAMQIEQRKPAFVWRTARGLDLIDGDGHLVMPVETRSARSDLPLLTGLGADAAAKEAAALVRTAAPIVTRLRGLVRIGERRWDVVLSDGQKIKLPEANPVAALEQVLAVDAAQDLFARDVMQVDMRDPRRPTVRLRPDAAQTLRQVKFTELGNN
ncbi:Cell division protein FtsQ [Rhodobacteraceae bacterium THAF1]|uniref:cell division protein FtsQ/DivIB n=1 Tax=Palleronia sp. THAF1 TaxID=2587842 RepID=UPI000F41C065|nr:cell division protein FtsQ/DivIB [Palleronia sp. THAF1]QFU09276.1 Cell division protein FtsQ [Palleronia sp. THAF1]VDC26588.1 Cell division protein FtsQ [Rhodobacteraceae bacterium THAF1]